MVKEEMDTSIAENILVFRTNLTNPGHIEVLTPVLNAMSDIEAWNVDMEDCDHILRVVSRGIEPAEVVGRLHDLGFVCEELEG